jgi:hypothetical protein
MHRTNAEQQSNVNGGSDVCTACLFETLLLPAE